MLQSYSTDHVGVNKPEDTIPARAIDRGGGGGGAVA